MDLTYDCSFKYFLKSKKTRYVLESIISLILDEPLEEVKKDLIIEDSELVDNFFKNEKGKITDILVTYKNTKINIELNRKYYKNIFENKLRYINNLYNASYIRGKDDTKEMFIQLNINDFDRDFQKRAEEYCYMYQENVLTKKIRVINISLVKLKKA